MNGDVFDLSGKKALVTGGASGLGKAMALALAKRGADVAVLDINEAEADRTAAAIAALGRQTIAVPVDVTSYPAVRVAVESAAERFGGIDVAVNAAGIADGRPEDTTPDAIWRRIIAVNLTGVYYCCLQEAEVMKRQKSGRIINVASMSSTVVNRFPPRHVPESRQTGLFPYCSAKAGVRQLTRVFAAFLAPHNVRVNCISPGYMRTPLTEDIFANPELVAELEDNTPVGRIGKPEDLEGLVVYLASDGSDFMTGSEILIDGGFTVW